MERKNIILRSVLVVGFVGAGIWGIYQSNKGTEDKGGDTSNSYPTTSEVVLIPTPRVRSQTEAMTPSAHRAIKIADALLAAAENGNCPESKFVKASGLTDLTDADGNVCSGDSSQPSRETREAYPKTEESVRERSPDYMRTEREEKPPSNR